MFYSSRFMNTLSELGGPITHQHKADEDSMFDAVKQGKGQGIKPADAALSYFTTQAEHGIRNDPARWHPIARQAALRVKAWLQQEKVGKQSAELLFDLVRNTKPDEA